MAAITLDGIVIPKLWSSRIKDWPSTEPLLLPPNLVILCFQTILSTTLCEMGLAGVVEKTHNAENNNYKKGEKHQDLLCISGLMGSERFSVSVIWGSHRGSPCDWNFLSVGIRVTRAVPHPSHPITSTNDPKQMWIVDLFSSAWAHKPYLGLSVVQEAENCEKHASLTAVSTTYLKFTLENGLKC